MADISALAAANAYKNQMKLTQDGGDAVAEQSSGTSGFAQLLQNMVQDSAATIQNAENLQIQSMSGGKVDLTDLVTAIANAELALNTVVTVRDRVISAYQDIIRMPI